MRPDTVPEAVRQGILGLGPAAVVVLGGPAVVSSEVLQALTDLLQ